MERGFVLTVVLLLAVAMFAGNFDSNPTGMQPIGFEFDDEGKTVKNNVLETPEKTLIARLDESGASYSIDPENGAIHLHQRERERERV